MEKAVDELLADVDLLKKWGRQGRERVMDRNSMASVTKRHVEFVESLLKEGSKEDTKPGDAED